MTSTKQLLFHCSAWLAFIIYELASIFFVKGSLAGLRGTLVYYALYIALFYFHAVYALPLVFRHFRRPWLPVLLLLLAETAAAVLLKYLIGYGLLSFRLTPSDSVPQYLFFSSWRALYFLAFSTAYFLVRRLIRYRAAIAAAERGQLIAVSENALLEKDVAELRYAYLQQQINPHFLFNTLNFIYTTVYKSSREAADAVVMLSDIMRYSLTSYDGSGRTDLAAEVDQIKTLVTLHRLRFTRDQIIELHISGELAGLTIIPLVLLTLTENMLKHGNFGRGASPASISIAVETANLLHFATRNQVRRKAVFGKSGIGLPNISKRLAHSYPGTHRLETREIENEFVLELTIKL